MKSRLIFRVAPAALAALLSLLFSGCVTTSNPESVAEENSVQAVEPWDGDGMDIPLDGSSLEAFDRYMARVKAHSTEANYTTLENAIEYLLVYDLGAKRDKATLVSRLDGLTGRQVVDKVGWQKNR
jgi:hypothetical protein